MKRLLAAFLLACVLTVTALAGDMPGGGKSAPGDMPGVNPGSAVVGEMPTVDGEVSGVPGDMPTVGESLVTTALLTLITTLLGR